MDNIIIHKIIKQQTLSFLSTIRALYNKSVLHVAEALDKRKHALTPNFH